MSTISNGVKLLVVTQTIDDADPILGFFTRWVEKLSAHFEHIEVICLSEGKHALPANVRVHTLGKPRMSEKEKRIIYDTSPLWVRRVRHALRFVALTWKLCREYDAVFVHMNQVYVLIAAPLWKLLGKRIYLWRNHGSGNFLTRIASAWCDTVFYTSRASYTARSRNAVRMPVGVDLERFTIPADVHRVPGSVLMAGRVSPKKHVREVVEALVRLKESGVDASLTLAGPLDDARYRDEVLALASAGNVGLSIRGPVAHAELGRIYAEHDIVVNVSEPGMFDKTMLEALASGCLLLAGHEDLAATLDPRCRTTGVPDDIAGKLKALMGLAREEREAIAREGTAIVKQHSLVALVAKLKDALYAY